jgi:hypothetical protein
MLPTPTQHTPTPLSHCTWVNAPAGVVRQTAAASKQGRATGLAGGAGTRQQPMSHGGLVSRNPHSGALNLFRCLPNLMRVLASTAALIQGDDVEGLMCLQHLTLPLGRVANGLHFRPHTKYAMRRASCHTTVH